MKRKHVFLLVAPVVAIMLMAGWIIISRQEKSICGGEGHPADFDQNGRLHDVPTRSLLFDANEATLWSGSMDSRLLAYDLEKRLLEQCDIDIPTKVPVNIVYKWQEKVFAGFDGYGVWQLRDNTWSRHLPTDIALDYRVYDMDTDPRNQNLLVSTWEGIFTFDGKVWRQFDLVPPLGPVNYHSILAVSENEWFFGAMHGGTYRYYNGIWERFTSQGFERFDSTQGWYVPFALDYTFQDEVREVELLIGSGRIRFATEVPFEIGEYSGVTIAIAADAINGSGLMFLHPGDPELPETYWVQVPQMSGFSLTHLTSVEALTPEIYTVTNWNIEEGAGTYFSNGEETTQLLGVPSFNLISMVDYTYVATATGVYQVQLPFLRSAAPFCGNLVCEGEESPLTCSADCGTATVIDGN